MFLSAYLLLLTFKMTATVACAVYCFKIASFRITPTFTWILFCVAFMLRFFTQLQAIVYTNNILGIYSQFSTALIIVNQVIEVIIISSFLIGIFRTYYGLKSSPLSG